MKKFAYRIIAIVLVAVSAAGCGSIQQETAMEWLARQPVFNDDP